MSNSLIKNTDTTFIPGVSGTPGRPAMPARTVTEVKRVCKFVPLASFGSGSGGTSLDLGGASGGGGTIYICSDEAVTTTYPATPSVPAVPGIEPSTTVDYHLGWNSGARSIKAFFEDGYGQFSVRRNAVGVICGLNKADAVDAHYLGTNIDFAFFCTHGIVRIQENGVTIMSAGTYDDTTVFRIERSGTSILYKVGGATVYTHTGAITANEPLWLEAALYSGGDEVFNPSVVQTTSLSLGSYAVTGQIVGVLPPLLDAIFGGGVSATMDTELPPLITSPMEAGIVAPSYALLGAALPPLDAFSDGLTGQMGQIAMTLPALDMLAADHPYGEMFLTLPPLDGDLWAVEGNTNASMGDAAVASDTMLGQSSLVVEFNSSGIVANVWTSTLTTQAAMNSSATVAAVFNLNAITSAIMNSSVIGGWMYSSSGTPDDGNPAISDGTETWAVNLQTSGSTQYENYGFNSFAEFNGRYYGAKADGLYLLEGDTDAGDLIRARIAFGKLDFGTTEKVTVEQCYVGMSGNGNLFLKVIANGVPYIYSTRSFSDTLQQQRVTTGKGLRTSYVELELYNEDGADFELDTVKFIVADLSRKI